MADADDGGGVDQRSVGFDEISSLAEEGSVDDLGVHGASRVAPGSHSSGEGARELGMRHPTRCHTDAAAPDVPRKIRVNLVEEQLYERGSIEVCDQASSSSVPDSGPGPGHGIFPRDHQR